MDDVLNQLDHLLELAKVSEAGDPLMFDIPAVHTAHEADHEVVHSEFGQTGDVDVRMLRIEVLRKRIDLRLLLFNVGLGFVDVSSGDIRGNDWSSLGHFVVLLVKRVLPGFGRSDLHK